MISFCVVLCREQFGIPHVAICNSKAKDFRGIDSYRTKSYIYCASGGYFDRCGEIETHFPQTIRHFRIFSKHYLAVANHPNETGILSYIFTFITYLKNYFLSMLVQRPKMFPLKFFDIISDQKATDTCSFYQLKEPRICASWISVLD